jgi:cell division protein FtsW
MTLLRRIVRADRTEPMEMPRPESRLARLRAMLRGKRVEEEAPRTLVERLDEQKPSLFERLRARVMREPSRDIDPTLPATASIVAVQQPSVEVEERPYDLWLLAAALGLLAIGTIAIFSSTAADGLAHHRNSTHFLEKQSLFLAVGGFAMWVGARIDYRRLKQWVYPLLMVSLVLLAVCLAMSARNGAKRWIPLGPLTFQPVEIAKLALVAYLAYSLGRKADRVKTFTIGFVPHLVVCSVMSVLLLAQPDLGSAVVLGATTLGVLFMAGARVSYIALALLSAAPVGYQLIVGTPWRLQRMNAFFNPEAYSNGEAYQFLQARLAMGSGGMTGTGLGGGYQSLGYMPEAHNDFILAPIGEEMGFVGVALVLVLFGILVWRGIRAALGARDVFGGYLAFGITLLFGVQVLFNVGVVLGIIPNKGITLPLVSAGGSSLALTMFLVGLLLNVGRRRVFGAADDGIRAAVRKKRSRVRVVIA